MPEAETSCCGCTSPPCCCLHPTSTGTGGKENLHRPLLITQSVSNNKNAENGASNTISTLVSNGVLDESSAKVSPWILGLMIALLPLHCPSLLMWLFVGQCLPMAKEHPTSQTWWLRRAVLVLHGVWNHNEPPSPSEPVGPELSFWVCFSLIENLLGLLQDILPDHLYLHSTTCSYAQHGTNPWDVLPAVAKGAMLSNDASSFQVLVESSTSLCLYWCWGLHQYFALLDKCTVNSGLQKTQKPKLLSSQSLKPFQWVALQAYGWTLISWPTVRTGSQLSQPFKWTQVSPEQSLAFSPSSCGYISVVGKLISVYILHARLLQLLFSILWDESLL